MINLPMEEIIKEYENGTMQSEIAGKYGVSQVYISIRIKKYCQGKGIEMPKPKIRRKKKIELPVEEIINKYEEGETLASLAADYKVESSTISRRIREYYKDKTMPKIINSATVIESYLKKGFTIEEILETASKKGLIVPRKTIDRALRKMSEEEIEKDE